MRSPISMRTGGVPFSFGSSFSDNYEHLAAITTARASPGSVLRISCGLLEQPIDGAPGNAEVLSDRRRAQRGSEVPDLCRVDTGRPALVFPVSLGSGNALALTLQHDLAFPGRHTGQDRQHQLRCWIAGIQAFATHAQDH